MLTSSCSDIVSYTGNGAQATASQLERYTAGSEDVWDAVGDIESIQGCQSKENGCGMCGADDCLVLYLGYEDMNGWF
jgi:hypothetical protein